MWGQSWERERELILALKFIWIRNSKPYCIKFQWWTEIINWALYCQGQELVYNLVVSNFFQLSSELFCRTHVWLSFRCVLDDNKICIFYAIWQQIFPGALCIFCSKHNCYDQFHKLFKKNVTFNTFPYHTWMIILWWNNLQQS